VIDPNRSGPSDQTAPANTSAAAQRVRLLRPAPSATTTAANTKGPHGGTTPGGSQSERLAAGQA
jgi:hypothetical protein